MWKKDMKLSITELILMRAVLIRNMGKRLESSCDGEVDLGVAICGTGLGISMAANKVHGVRAAVCSEPYTAKMAREHNNANVIAFGARVIGIEMAKMILDTFLGAEFLGGRHQDRVDMIMAIEENQ